MSSPGNMFTMYSDDTPKGHAMFLFGKVIDTVILQPLDYIKVARQVEYVSKKKIYPLDNGLPQRYSSAFKLNLTSLLTGQSMALIQSGVYGLGAVYLYPALVQHYRSINGSGLDKDPKNNLFAAATIGLLQGIINVPLENIKLRQIGNRLLSDYPKDFKYPQHPNFFLVTDFFRDDAKAAQQKYMTIKKQTVKGSPESKKQRLQTLKTLEKAITAPKDTSFLTYIDLKKRMQSGLIKIPHEEYYKIMKTCKTHTDSYLKNPAVGVMRTIKEMVQGGKFDGKNVFTNGWYLTIPIPMIEATIFIGSMQHLAKYVYEFNSGMDINEMSYGGRAYTKMKELGQYIPGLHMMAPLFVGVPSALLTVVLTQPLDSLKTILQSGLFLRYRALSDSKVITLPKNNAYMAFKTFYGCMTDMSKLYHGSVFRFFKLSLFHAGLGFVWSRGLFNYVDTYLENRKLVA